MQVSFVNLYSPIQSGEQPLSFSAVSVLTYKSVLCVLSVLCGEYSVAVAVPCALVR